MFHKYLQKTQEEKNVGGLLKAIIMQEDKFCLFLECVPLIRITHYMLFYLQRKLYYSLRDWTCGRPI